jgi:hypothetical protein
MLDDHRRNTGRDWMNEHNGREFIQFLPDGCEQSMFKIEPLAVFFVTREQEHTICFQFSKGEMEFLKTSINVCERGGGGRVAKHPNVSW